ncbi:hypothetical protein TCDM_08780 [Trypanosoma cruzi Dm28c]|uniref:Uncharacterized protein n=1 Tax=Trypanosoma cruzi Dm28c TaxID=1416333 RepID=V5ARI2_TRYCR|nr:hypothetical protein TCDM_08780 [Trypanosoma cruzi Dm28c]
MQEVIKFTGGSEPSPPPLPPSTSLLVCEKQMVKNQPGEFLYKRQEVLAYIKSFLQPAYDRGSLSCQQFVSIAKQTLLFVMSARNIGMQGFSKEFVAQVVQLQMTHVPHKTAPTTPMSTPLVECKKGGHIPCLHAQPGDHHNDDDEARGEKKNNNNSCRYQQEIVRHPHSCYVMAMTWVLSMELTMGARINCFCVTPPRVAMNSPVPLCSTQSRHVPFKGVLPNHNMGATIETELLSPHFPLWVTARVV